MHGRFVPITTHTYGDASKQEIDCILIAFHGDAGEQFFSEYPIFHMVHDTDELTFDEYLRLEPDIGTKEIAHETAAHLASELPIRVDVLESHIPRAILDLGRATADRAIRTFFDQKSHSDILDQLHELHAHAHRAVWKTFLSLSSTGVWIDIHSMAPHDPGSIHQHAPDPVMLQPFTIRTYVDAYIDPRKRGAERPTNIATINASRVHSAWIADRRLSESVLSSLNNAGILSKYNIPHPMDKHITSAVLMEEFGRGVVVDFPKNELIDQRANVSFLDSSLSPEKIEHVSRALAKGISKALDK